MPKFDILNDEKILELELLIYRSKNNLFKTIDDLIIDLDIYSTSEFEANEDLNSFNEEDEENVFLSDIELKKTQLKEELYNLIQVFDYKLPFNFKDDILEYNVKNIPNKSYLFCLYLAKNGAGIDKEKNIISDDFGKYFEHITEIALKKSRPDYNIKRIENVRNELEKICYELGICFHSIDRLNKNAQDAGVDLIAYRKTHKNALRGHIILVQCAAGKNYQKKDKDINIDHWKGYMGDLYTHSKMISIPNIYLTRERHELGGSTLGDAGEIFDRICLLQFIDETKLKEQYKETYDIIQKYEWIK
ncbi:hypothetical protein BFL38_10655 [Brachyspira hampsonii]|uniref:Uncharacterized protein n=1 Tax=Brachyspira hampsonii TaxID=1287055 RepID=A0A1E5NI85_9SPIR|nr:hypothetical protein [Brachyspira hampsonii]OEJ15909.1 hypothetical protein BFL38_10655 [Brachyspira hampsonii]